MGTLFDDGCHALSGSLYTMAVNANSVNKEGAWEFITFLLGEEVQCKDELDTVPVHRDYFHEWLERQIQLYTEVQYKNGKPYISPYVGIHIPEEKKEAYEKAIEDARPLPIQTAPILKIIQEEAEDYFNGSKSAEEVSRVINNRVQLYLNER